MTSPVLAPWVGGEELPSRSGRTGDLLDPATGEGSRVTLGMPTHG